MLYTTKVNGIIPALILSATFVINNDASVDDDSHKISQNVSPNTIYLVVVCVPTLLTNLKEKRSVFTFQNQNILSTTLQLQGHKGRRVQFGTCVKNFILNASCELHRPAFMTLEPIRFLLSCWEIISKLKYNNNIRLRKYGR